ncbi:MAG TPA: hypothetical protein VHM26_06530 [Chitinophagaceae bacterium]|jgi:cell division protein FtsW (lipid II flippase)|nr:hypothetical protein [Chitinophagaceae bacterium]
MKQLTRNILLRISLLLFAATGSVIAFAQDKGVDIDVNVKKEGNWYAQPWVWVVGGAVFILLLVALLRSGSRRSA